MSELSKILEGFIGLNPGIWSFLFFLLIFCMGYMFVEMGMGRRYFFRTTLDGYQNNYFDRILHYVIWGILVNIFFFFFLYLSHAFDPLIKFFNSIGPVADAFKNFTNNSVVQTQLAIFWVYYFFFMFVFFLLPVRLITFFDVIMDSAFNLGEGIWRILIWLAKYLGKSKFWKKKRWFKFW